MRGRSGWLFVAFLALSLWAFPAHAEGDREIWKLLPGEWRGFHAESGTGSATVVPVEYHLRNERGTLGGEIARFDADRVDVAPIRETSISGMVVTFVATYMGGTWNGKHVRYQLFLNLNEERLEGWGYDLKTERSFGVVLQRQ